MKNLFLLILFIDLFFGVYAQKKLLTQTYHCQKLKGTIIDFLEELNHFSGILLEYSSGNFDANKIIQLQGDETTIGKLLQKILDGQRVKLVEYNNKILVVPSTEVFAVEAYLPAHYSVFGYIKEESSKEPLMDATIYEASTKSGVVSNNYGYFNLFLPEGKHKIEISYIGMEPIELEMEVHDNIRKDIVLQVKKQSEEKTVVIESEAPVKDGGLNILADQALSNMLLGEADPVRNNFLSPGVQCISSSFAGYQVRGGGPDENLFLMDGNPVYNPTHLLGALSIINLTALKTLRFYKSDFPARFSGSLSSVIDVYTKDGNMQSWHGEGNAGLLTGSFTLEGPLSNNKTAIMLSARKSISLPFYRSFNDLIVADFYDAHFRLTNIINAKNKLSFNYYQGEDKLKQNGKDINNLHKWGNILGAVGWNYLLGNRSFINTSLNLSQYENLGGFQYTLYQGDDENVVVQTRSIGTFSSIQQFNIKSQAEFYVSQKIKINSGIKAAQITIKPFDTKISDTLQENEQSFTSFQPLTYQEFSVFGESDIMMSRKLFLKPGLHASEYNFKNYHSIALEPRFYVAYKWNHSHMVYASYSKMNQFLHLVTNPYLGFNNDLWVPSTEHLNPEWSEMSNLGYSFRYQKRWKISVDGYYKHLNNVTSYAEGKSIFINDKNWEQTIETGKGRSYGAECMVMKRGDKLKWQVAYALSWSWRQFASVNDGNEFPYKYDRRHTANFAFNYSITNHIDAIGLFTFATGDVYTLPSQIYPDFDNAQQVVTPDDPLASYRFIYNFSGTNQYRTQPYKRYDAAISYHSGSTKKIYNIFTAGVYNINGETDQYIYTLRGSLSSKSIIIKTGNSIFKMTPYVSYTLKF